MARREELTDEQWVLILRGQQSPLRAGACDPQDGFEETAAVAPASESDLWTGFQDGQNPSAIGHRLA